MWGTRYPDGGSVHLLTWPAVDRDWRDEGLAAKWTELRRVRERVNEEIEPLRRAKAIGSSLEARVALSMPKDQALALDIDWAELFISSDVIVEAVTAELAVVVSASEDHKCGRCWRYLPEVAEDGVLCARCEDVVGV